MSKIRNREPEKKKAAQNYLDGWCKNHPGVKPRDNSSFCEYCYQRSKKNKDKHIQNGRCRNHPNIKSLPNRNICEVCRVAQGRRENNRRSDGFCINHPSIKVDGDSIRCTECLIKSRFTGIKSKFSITEEKYKEECKKRDNKCDLCKATCIPIGNDIDESKTQRFHIDHDHKTDKIRGLLCHQCNIFLGHFKEDVSRLKRFMAGLERYLSDENPGIVKDVVKKLKKQ